MNLKLLIILVGVLIMPILSNSSPFPYNPSYPIGISKNSTFFDLFNSPNNEYFDFYVNESGLLISNYPDRLIAQQKICFELNSINYCLNELPLTWKNSTDNLTYVWLNGTYSTAVLDFQLKYSLNQTEEKIKIDLLSKNKFMLAQKINVSYNHFNLSLDNSNGSETFVWIDETRYNLTLNQTISNILARELRIYGIAENPFIYMSWNDTAVVEIKGKEVYLKFINLQIAPNQEMTKTIFWIDPINSVTLNDPTTDITIYSSKWFWMNCTVAKQGQGDTPDSLQFHHNNSNPTMIRIPVNTSSTTLNTSSTNPIDPFLYATMYNVNVSTPNVGTYQIQCQANNSAGTTVYSAIRKITVLQTNVTFNQSTLSLTANQYEAQSFLQTANITSRGTNNDVNISCLTGSCSTITTNFTSLDLLDNGTNTVFFNCSTSTAGFFSANFTVNSTEYQNSTLSDTKQINVSCSITADTTPPDILIRNPANNSVLISNKTYANYTYGADSNAIWYELDSNDTNITIAKGTNITFIDLSLIIHNISVYANDSLNNINSSFINFSIRDATPPDILTVNPSNNTVLTTNYTSVNYTYGTDAVNITYELDSNNTNISIAVGSNITFTNLANAVYNITLYANDSFNNINSSFVNFSINYIAPSITGMKIKKWESIDWIQDLGEKEGNTYNVSNHIFNPIRWLFTKIKGIIEWIF